VAEPSLDWSGSCQFNWLDGVDLKLRSSWSSNSLTRFGRCHIRIEPISDVNIRSDFNWVYKPYNLKTLVYTSVVPPAPVVVVALIDLSSSSFLLLRTNTLTL